MNITRDMAESVAVDLRTLGYDAAVSERRLKIRLALLCGVTVEFHDEGIRFFPTFGFASRTAATWLTSLVWSVAWFGLIIDDPASAARWGLPTVVIIVAALVWDVYRYVLTESAMTVIRNLLVSRCAA